MRRKMTSMLPILFLSIAAIGQINQLPTDPQLKTGRLSNGLTYYIRSNPAVKGFAEFHIVQKVGSMQEEDNQKGLAHFLEHMAFNGTKNFPGSSMLRWLEKNGVSFGSNINAYTNFDETVYSITGVPVSRKSVADSCLLILHDWSGFISLDDEEIDKERGVIREEWRTRNDAANRVYSKTIEDLFAGSKYADRLPIGSMDIIGNFRYKELRDYYHKWYRPDLQAVIIVGDIDPNAVEAHIKKLFSDIPKPVNAAKRIYYQVSDSKEPMVSITKDPELSFSRVSVNFKQDKLTAEQALSFEGIENFYKTTLLKTMLSSRLANITKQPNPPFVDINVAYDKFYVSATKDALLLEVKSFDGGTAAALTAILTEAERVKRFGFTDSEFKRTSSMVISYLENLYREKDSQANDYFASQYVDNFLYGKPLLSIEEKYKLYKQVYENLTLDQLNKFAADVLGKSSLAISISGPSHQSYSYPTKEDVLATVGKVENEPVTPYSEKVIDSKLIAKEPVSGKVVKTAKGQFGDIIWTLSNGATVVLKPTSFKQDEVIFTGVSEGGASNFEDKDIPNLKVVNEVVNIGGLGEHSAADLTRLITGKRVQLAYNQVGIQSSSIAGAYSPDDAETMLQLLYLAHTSPRYDEAAYQIYLNNKRATFYQTDKNPTAVFNDTTSYMLYGNEPRMKALTLSDLEAVSYKRCLDIYRQVFGNAANFTYVFAGNIDTVSLKPLIEKYVASLPTENKKVKARKLNVAPQKGIHIKDFEIPMSTPKASVFTYLSGKMAYTPSNIVKLNMLSLLLNNLYTQKIREDKGGTYGVFISYNISSYPYENFTLSVSFDTAPELAKEMQKVVMREIEAIARSGCTDEDLTKVKEYLLKSQEENLRSNNYWVNSISNYYSTRLNLITGYDKMVRSATAGDIKKMAAAIISQNNRIELLMNTSRKK